MYSAGYNFYETRSRTKVHVFGVDNEHGCAFGITMHVDTLKYAGKLNNKHVKNAYTCTCICHDI